MPTIRIVGPGRAGRSLAMALDHVGWTVLPLLGRDDDVGAAALGADAVVLAVPDDVIAPLAALVRPRPGTVLVHLAGSLGPDVLTPHERRAAMHPLVALPDPVTGAARLSAGVTFAVAGDPFARRMAEALGGAAVDVPDEARATYHAAASIAANHVVGLLGQVERVARGAGLPLEAFLPLARAAVEDAGRLGPRRALTGPAARGDWQTLARHLDAIGEAERPAYRAGVGLALALTVGVTGVTGVAGLGESGVGESGVGESGVGESGVGESGVGESGVGESGVGESGVGGFEAGPVDPVDPLDAVADEPSHAALDAGPLSRH